LQARAIQGTSHTIFLRIHTVEAIAAAENCTSRNSKAWIGSTMPTTPEGRKGIDMAFDMLVNNTFLLVVMTVMFR